MASIALNEQTVTEAEKIGRYEIVHKLASGGMGEVFLARALGAAGFQKHVVIKKLLPHLLEQPQFVEGLIREAKLLVLLNHPNIVQVLDLGMEEGDYFMAMEYVHGYNLATIIHYCADRQQLIPFSACVSICLNVLAGLEYAHLLVGPDGAMRNIVHRDVSPQNVLISNEGRVKLTDFGIAKIISDVGGEFTQSLKGKFRYMAPEILDGHRIDHRYDLFAVGILLFESLCRRHLFGGTSDMTILNQVREAKVPAVSQYYPGLPRPLTVAVERALAKDPAIRFQSATAFAQALRQAIQPLGENEAASDLRAFITELYRKPDFPLNKPKLPDLNSTRSSLTRSIVLESRLIEGKKQRRARQKNVIVLGLLGGVLVSAFIVVFVYTLWSPPVDDPPPAKQPVIIIAQKSDGAPPRPDRGAPPDMQARDRITSRSIRQPAPRRPFNAGLASKALRRQGRALEKCFYRHSTSTEKQLTFRMISSIRGHDGTVTQVRFEPAALAATPLGRCIQQIGKRVRYPRFKQPLIDFGTPVTLKKEVQ